MCEKNKIRGLALLLILTLILAGCTAGSAESGGTDAAVSEETQSGEAAEDSGSAEAVQAAAGGAAAGTDGEMFTDRDYRTAYDENASASILLSGSTASCDSDAVEIDGGTVTIIDEGTYVLSGTLDDGTVIVDTDKEDKVQLVLNGVTIHSEASAAVYVRQADKVIITLAADTENVLSNGGTFTADGETNIDGVIFSRDDLTLNGEGSLTITSPGGHGIVSKDDLAITGGNYEITASSHGLSGKDCVKIAAGIFAIDSGKDGIQGENDEDDSLGYVYIAGGTFVLTAGGDGISASGTLQIQDGTFRITAGGGAAAASQSYGTSSADDTSTKGIKSGTNMTLNGGTYTIDTRDDALHSNADLAINGGTWQISTGDDGVHADNGLTVSGGTIEIEESYEGLEGLTVDITGGEITLTASDDGLNAAGGNDESGFGGFRGGGPFDADDSASIHISGGTLYINAEGDGIDSNGSLTVSGGQVFVSGAENGGNGALDYGTEATVTGGVVIAAGMSQMAQNFGDSSTQGVMLVTVDRQEAGTLIQLEDESGQVLVSWAPDKGYDSVVISCPEITEGSVYTLTAGTWSEEITMDSLVCGTGGFGSFGGFGGGRGGEERERGVPGGMPGGEGDGPGRREDSSGIPDIPREDSADVQQ